MPTPFDMSLIQRGARLRRSPYFEATQRAGCRGYTVYNHMFLPIAYDDLEREYWKLLNDVTVWDVAVERQVEITGPDAFAFANLLTPRDLAKCAVGQGKYVVITAEDGGIVNDPVLLRLGENHFWLALADSDVLLWAKGIAYRSGLEVELREPDVSPLQIQGPKSKQVLEKLFGPRVREMPYYHFFETTLDGIPVVVTRTGWTGEVGYEIYLYDASLHGEELWDKVLEAGRPHGLEVIGPCHIRRIEGGILAFGADMWYDNNPFEVGYHYTWMVDLDQEADFMGKAALKRIKEEGVTRKLVGVDIEGEPLGSYIDNEMIDFFPVYADGRRVGKVTSACWSPRLEKNIGYAMLPIEFTDLGTELEVDTPKSGRVRAVVVPMPHWDPKKEIPKR